MSNETVLESWEPFPEISSRMVSKENMFKILPLEFINEFHNEGLLLEGQLSGYFSVLFQGIEGSSWFIKGTKDDYYLLKNSLTLVNEWWYINGVCKKKQIYNPSTNQTTTHTIESFGEQLREAHDSYIVNWIDLWTDYFLDSIKHECLYVARNKDTNSCVLDIKHFDYPMMLQADEICTIIQNRLMSILDVKVNVLIVNNDYEEVEDINEFTHLQVTIEW